MLSEELSVEELLLSGGHNCQIYWEQEQDCHWAPPICTELCNNTDQPLTAVITQGLSIIQLTSGKIEAKKRKTSARIATSKLLILKAELSIFKQFPFKITAPT